MQIRWTGFVFEYRYK